LIGAPMPPPSIVTSAGSVEVFDTATANAKLSSTSLPVIVG